jgi:hypothetical protein
MQQHTYMHTHTITHIYIYILTYTGVTIIFVVVLHISCDLVKQLNWCVFCRQDIQPQKRHDVIIFSVAMNKVERRECLKHKKSMSDAR